MGQMGRPGLSAAQKADLWQRWKQGQSLSEIGRALGTHAGSIHGVLSANGGFMPPVRTRSRWALTLAEREEIARGLATARSIRQIAATLGRARRPSAGKSIAMVEPSPIAPRRPTRKPGHTHAAPSPVGLPPPLCFSRLSRANWRWNGHRHKSRDGSNWNSQIKTPCGSLMKPSTVVCLFKHVGCSRRN